MLRRRFLSVLSSFAAFCLARVALGAETDPAGGNPNLQTFTFGGLQYWADELIFHSYRIQRNTLTSHYRLLNASEERLAWGTFDECRAKLEEIKRTEKLKPMPKHVVLTLHGMIRTRHSMNGVAVCVGQNCKIPAFTVGYPSTQESIPQHAQSLDRLVRNLDGVESVDVVAYSMGSLVTRHWLGDVAAETAERAKRGLPAVARPTLRRLVMIGPPNNGAERANLWAESTVGRELFRFVVGDGGEQLGPRFHEIKERLVTPPCEFGIIAGGKGDEKGWHDGITGDDDGTVGVEETKVAGAHDFVVVPLRHTFLIHDARVQKMTCTFLEHGHFESAAKRNPLPR